MVAQATVSADWLHILATVNLPTMNLPRRVHRHIELLGTLIGNLQAFEFALRATLLSIEKPSGKGNYDKLNIGDTVRVDAFTDFRTLRKLIADYNNYIITREPSLIADIGLVDLRDALSHGRVFTMGNVPMRLLKFAKPANGKATVDFAATLDETWFYHQMKWVFEEAEKVLSAKELIDAL